MPGPKKVPRQIAEQVAESERIENELSQGGAESGVALMEPPDQSGAVDLGVSGEPVYVDPGLTTSPPGAIAIPAAQETLEDVIAERDNLKAQFNTLRGKYDAEVPRLHSLVSELQLQMQSLQNERTRVAPTTAPVTSDVPSHLVHLNPQEIEDAGQQNIDTQGKVAKGVVQAEMAKLDEKLAAYDRRMNQVELVQGETQAQNIWDAVDKLSPGAKNIELTDINWRTWLSQPDPLTGVSRRELGMSALHSKDVRRLASLIEEFKRDTGITTHEKLSSQVKPERSKAGVSQTASTSRLPTYKESYIKQVYNDSLRGAYKGREAEVAKLKADFDQAMVDGRVLVGQ